MGVFGVPFGCLPGVLTEKSWVAWSKTLFSQSEVSIASATLSDEFLFLEIWRNPFAGALGVHSGCLAGALQVPCPWRACPFCPLLYPLSSFVPFCPLCSLLSPCVILVWPLSLVSPLVLFVDFYSPCSPFLSPLSPLSCRTPQQIAGHRRTAQDTT